MDEATLARVIEPYFTTKGVGSGTGLGLSMFHSLAAQSGGRLALRSAVGSDTVAELTLPIAISAEPFVVRTVPPPPEAPCRRTILLVADEELVRMAIADGLRELGYDVVEAHLGQVALGHMNSGVRPDLLITDHLMPGMTGHRAGGRGATRDIEIMVKPFRQADVARCVAILMARPR